MSEQSDAELLASWRAGDTGAGARLFDRYAPAIAFFFRNKLSGGTEDLVQQTFLGLVEGHTRIEAGASVRSYLFAIAHNLLRKHLRKLSRSPGFDTEVSAAADLDPGPSTIIAKKREQRLLLAALRQIPLDHQIALELYYWEDFNAAQIAEIVGVSHSAMRSRMAKARQLLEAKLRELAESPAQLESTLGGLDEWAASIRSRD